MKLMLYWKTKLSSSITSTEKSKPSKWAKRILSILYSFTIGLSLFGSPLVVFADDYDYIPIDELSQYNAFRFFQNLGWRTDYTNTISYVQDLEGTFTYTGTVNGSILGSESSSYTVSLSGNLNTLEDGSYVSGSETGGILSTPVGVLSLTLEPVDSAYEENTVMACTFSNPNTNVHAYSSMSCTSGGGYEPAEYDVTLNMLGLSTTNSTAYEISISETSSGGGSAAGTISLNETMTYSGSGSLDIEGTISTTGHKIYDLPLLTLGTKDNNYRAEKLIRVNNTNEYHIVYLTNGTNTYQGNLVWKNTNGTDNTYIQQSSKFTYLGGFVLYDITVKGNNSTYRTAYPYTTGNINYSILPVFVGYKYQMSDDLYKYLYGDTVNNINDRTKNTNSDFSDVAELYDGIENDAAGNFSDELENVPTTSQLFSNNYFLSSANWVKVQFERIVENTPFELVIIYSLILGIALVIIGKLR